MINNNMDKYIPTEEEKKKFGRMNAGYSTSTNVKKVDLAKVHKSVLKDLYNLTNLVSDRSKKKLDTIIWDCWKEENSTPKAAINFIKSATKSFPINEKNKIDEKLKELERKYHVV